MLHVVTIKQVLPTILSSPQSSTIHWTAKNCIIKFMFPRESAVAAHKRLSLSHRSPSIKNGVNMFRGKTWKNYCLAHVDEHWNALKFTISNYSFNFNWDFLLRWKRAKKNSTSQMIFSSKTCVNCAMIDRFEICVRTKKKSIEVWT